MAIAVNGGHVSRALDFYKSVGKYFIIGGTTPWDDETSPDPPDLYEFRLKDVVGLKKVENTHLVIPQEDGTIQYRDQNWKIVTEYISTRVSTNIPQGSYSVAVSSVAGLTEGSKVRIANLYEGKITSINENILILDTAAPDIIPETSLVEAGARVEGAKYVYIDCRLRYDEFPLVTYRQIGICTGVTPSASDILLSASYSSSGKDEFTSLGTLEVLDNRPPYIRDIATTELLSIIIEF